MRTPTAHVTRRIVVITLVVAAAHAGCRDQPVAGPRIRGIQPPLHPTSPSFDLGDPQTVTVPVSTSADGSGSAFMSTSYSKLIFATVTFSGLITQQQNYAPHNSLQYGPAGLQGHCQGLLRIDFDSGGGSWWPSTGCTPGTQIMSSWSAQIGVKGLGHVSRGAGPTACDSAPPCFTYSGNQTVTITPATVGLAETVNQSIVNPGTMLAFNASPTAYLPSHLYWGITEWRWIPDVGSQSVQCVGWGDTCYFTPPGSGTMQVTGTMNGVVRTATVRVIVQCLLSGPAADSTYVKIANDTNTRQLARLAWDSSHANGNAADRRERVAQWGFSTDPPNRRVALFKDSLTEGDTPCRSDLPQMIVRQDTIFVLLHTQPFRHGDFTPLACHQNDPNHSAYYSATKFGGPSPADYYVIWGTPGWGVVADSTNLYVFSAPASMTFATHVDNGKTIVDAVTSNWRPYVRQYSRKQGTCNLY